MVERRGSGKQSGTLERVPDLRLYLERKTGFEPATLTLAIRNSRGQSPPLTCIDAGQMPFLGPVSHQWPPLRTPPFRPKWHESGTNICPHSVVGQWSTGITARAERSPMESPSKVRVSVVTHASHHARRHSQTAKSSLSRTLRADALSRAHADAGLDPRQRRRPALEIQSPGSQSQS